MDFSELFYGFLIVCLIIATLVILYYIGKAIYDGIVGNKKN